MKYFFASILALSSATFAAPLLGANSPALDVGVDALVKRIGAGLVHDHSVAQAYGAATAAGLKHGSIPVHAYTRRGELTPDFLNDIGIIPDGIPSSPIAIVKRALTPIDSVLYGLELEIGGILSKLCKSYRNWSHTS